MRHFTTCLVLSADERDALPAEEEPVVSMAEGAEERHAESGGRREIFTVVE
jgi:hypothetical protein